jgi:hypothetical protein
MSASEADIGAPALTPKQPTHSPLPQASPLGGGLRELLSDASPAPHQGAASPFPPLPASATSSQARHRRLTLMESDGETIAR